MSVPRFRKSRIGSFCALLAASNFGVLSASNGFARSLTWDGTDNPYLSANWDFNNTLTAPSVGDALTISSGEAFFDPTGPGSITLSSTSDQGQSLSVTGGLFFIDQSGDPSDVHGLLLDDGGELSVTAPESFTLDGPLSVGDAANASATATFSNAFMSIGWNYLGNPPDEDLYVGKFGNGTVTQSGDNSTIITYGTGSVYIAAEPGSTGTYNLDGGELSTNTLYVSGMANAASILPGGAGTFNMNGGTLAAQNILIGSRGNFVWNGGLVSIEGTAGLDIGAAGPFGSDLSIGPTRSLGVSNALTIDPGSELLLDGGSLAVGSLNLISPSDFIWTAGAFSLTGSGGMTLGPSSLFGSTLNIGPDKSLSVASTLTLFPGGSLSLTGGSLSAGVLDTSANPGGFSWSSGILSITGTGGFTLEPSTALGAHPTIGANQTLVISKVLTIPGTSSLTLAGGTATVGGLSVSPGGFIDVGKDQLLVQGFYNPTSILDYLASGYNGGKWNGSGINSSFVAAHADKYGLGYSVSSVGVDPPTAPGITILIEPALQGDTNLDGTVNLTDLLTLLNNYDQTGKEWMTGDFNYDGTVNLSDLLALLNNYGQSAPTTAASLGHVDSVPEPTMPCLLLVGSAGILAARRRGACLMRPTLR